MICDDVRQRMVETYVAGQLGEDARDEFERHYFECDRCFGEVLALMAVRQALEPAFD